MMLDDKQALISKLKKDLLSWQGVAQSLNDECAIDLGLWKKLFQMESFPKVLYMNLLALTAWIVLLPVDLLVLCLEN